MRPNEAQSIADLLTYACTTVIPVPDREPWEYGWAVPSYRRSEQAALHGPNGPVSISNEGIDAWEKAVTGLLREKRVKDRWDSEEFWGIVASMVAVAASKEANERAAYIEGNVEMFRKISPALTLQLIANVNWGCGPVSFGDIIIGDANMEFIEYVNSWASRRSRIKHAQAESWLERVVQPRIMTDSHVTPVGVACWTTGQFRLATKETERQFRNLVDLTVLLERDLRGFKVYHRGPTNRPGIRGLTLDREALDRGLSTEARIELASFPLTISSIGETNRVNWYSPEPLPLGKLLDQEYLRNAVTSCLRKRDAVSSRVKVAARWFADAHYSLEADDSALALGVAMDALLSGQRALPGSAMADRFAFLGPDPRDRKGLVASYHKFFAVRSSVAHGGRSSKLDDPDFLDEYRDCVHWAAWRFLAMRDNFNVVSENDIDLLYDDLRLGIRAWT